METLLANLSGAVRRETLNGRTYLVAPLTMIVPGVLNGSQGALYYPPSEVEAAADSWNGIPITLRHPVDAQGNPTSARQPGVLARVGLGTVYAANYDGKLTAEGWFDEELTKSRDPGVHAALLSGKPTELSTGLFTRNKAPDGTVYNGRCPSTGRSYEYVAKRHRPDHLAVLPDQVGACSLKDGCGVLVNQLCPTCGKGPTDHAIPDRLSGNAGGNCGIGDGGFQPGNTCAGGGGGGSSGSKAKGHSVKLPKSRKKLKIDQAKTALDEMGFNLGKSDFDLKTKTTTYELTHPDGSKSKASTEQIKEIVYRGANNAHATPDKLSGNAFCPTGEGGGIDPSCLAGGKSGASGSIGIEGLAKTGQEGGKTLQSGTKVKFHEGEHKGHTVTIESVIPMRYRKEQVTYRGQIDGIKGGAGQVIVTADILSKYATLNQSSDPDPAEDLEVNKLQLVQWLTTNCDCYKKAETALNGMDEATLKTLKAKEEKATANALVVNSLRKDLELPEDLASNEMPAFIKKKMAKKMGPDDDMDDDDDSDTEKKGKKMTGNAKPQTLAEWEASIPAEAKQIFNAAKKVERREKAAICNRLVANIKDDEGRRKKFDKLMTKNLAELEELVELIPAPVQNRDEDDEDLFDDGRGRRRGRADYSGAGEFYEAPVSNADFDADDVLPLPEIDYAELAKSTD